MILTFFLCQFFNANIDLHRINEVSQEIADSVQYVVYESFEQLEEEVFSIGEDELLVVNFWATWCAPCIKELPYFEALNQEQEVRVVLVSLDFVEQLEKRLDPFILKHKIKSELYVLDDMDANKWIDMVDPTWSGTIPATLLIKGKKRHFTANEFTSVQEIKTFISQIDKK